MKTLLPLATAIFGTALPACGSGSLGTTTTGAGAGGAAPAGPFLYTSASGAYWKTGTLTTVTTTADMTVTDTMTYQTCRQIAPGSM